MAALEPRVRQRPPRANFRSSPSGIIPWRQKYSRLLLATDAVSIAVAIGLAHRLRFSDQLWFEHTTNVVSSLGFSAGLFLTWMAGLAIGRSRDPRVLGAGAEEYRQVVRATALVFGGIGLLSVLLKVQLSRGYLMIVLPVGIVLLILSRWLWRVAVVRARQKHGTLTTRMVAVGNVHAVAQLCSALSRVPWSEYRVVGACVSENFSRPALEIPGAGAIPVLGDESAVVDAVLSTGADAVAVTGTRRLNGGGLTNLSWELEKLDVELLVAPGIVDIAGQRLHMRPVAALPLIHVEKPQYRGAKRFKKGFYDVVFSTLVLLLLSPLLLIIAAVVKCTSRGPVLYRSWRIGLDGRPFEMLKFRTMVEGADAMTADLSTLDLVASPRDPFKFVDDPRVTNVGRFLRKYSLDELPQFINVLKRDMSVVGPRPQVPKEVENYDHHARRRLLVRPGITGLWQVNGRADLSWEDSVRLDLFYVENWSTTADLLISLKTLKAIVQHTGAY